MMRNSMWRFSETDNQKERIYKLFSFRRFGDPTLTLAVINMTRNVNFERFN